MLRNTQNHQVHALHPSSRILHCWKAKHLGNWIRFSHQVREGRHLLWCVPYKELTSLTGQPMSKSKLIYDWWSDSQYVLVSSPPWDLWSDITFCRKVAVWKLWSCFCGTPSLMTGWVCSLQCNRSMVWVAQNHTLLSHLRLPEPAGSGFRIYISQEQGGPVIPPDTGFPFTSPLTSCKAIVEVF
jgi:hypothetical protein